MATSHPTRDARVQLTAADSRILRSTSSPASGSLPEAFEAREACLASAAPTAPHPRSSNLRKSLSAAFARDT